MKRALLLALAACGDNSAPLQASDCTEWHQWGGNAAHDGVSCAAGQPLERVLADVVLDPMAALEEADSYGELTIHYQVPLVDGDAVYVMTKGGTYTPCDQPIVNGTAEPNCGLDDELYRLNSETWNEVRYVWRDGTLVVDWSFESDWKPEPNVGFEPMFQPALSGGTIAVPGAAGSLWLLDTRTGDVIRHVTPHGFDADTYVAGAITERGGTFYYNALSLDHDAPWTTHARGWLVAVAPDGTSRAADYRDLVPGAPAATDACYTQFDLTTTPFPWPPPPNSDGTPVLPPVASCGGQLPGINSAPALALDGSLFVVTHAQYNERYSYLVSVDPSSLSTNWVRSLRGRLADACGVLADCRDGTSQDVEPTTNLPAAAMVENFSSSSPVVTPEGTVLYGALDGYTDRGHLLAFDHDGTYRGNYTFGWDTTPAIAGARIVLKDNWYFDPHNTEIKDPGPYYITALDASSLLPVWQFQSTETKTCVRAPDGSLTCTDDHPNGFEWCVNAPVVDRDGTVFANSEDGHVYAITADGQLRDRFFLDRSLGAAYTPLALDHAGRIYALNNGHLFVIGAN